jgi:hypothetical protein
VIVADLIDSAILNFNHFSADGLDHKARERRSLRVRAVRKTLSSLLRRKSVVERLDRLEYLAASKGPNAVLRPRPTNERVEGLSRLTEWGKSHFPAWLCGRTLCRSSIIRLTIRRASGVRADIRFRTSPRNRHAASCRWSLSARRAYRATTEPSAPAGPGSRRGQG